MKEYSNIDFYHGSDDNINTFDKDKIGKNFKESKAFYFTTNTEHDVVGKNIYEDPYSAGAYAKNTIDGNPIIYICNLDIKNPLTIKYISECYYLDQKDPFNGDHPQDFLDKDIDYLIQMAKDEGFDSIILDQSIYSDSNEITAIVFNSEQINFKYQSKNKLENKPSSPISNFINKKINNKKINFVNKSPTTSTFHYSRHGDDIKSFDKYNNCVGSFDAIGVHSGGLESVNDLFNGWGHRGDNGGIIYPLLITTQKPLLNNDGSIMSEVEIYKILDDIKIEIESEDNYDIVLNDINQIIREKLWSKYDSIPYINAVEGKGSISYITPAESMKFKITNKSCQSKKIKNNKFRNI